MSFYFNYSSLKYQQTYSVIYSKEGGGSEHKINYRHNFLLQHV
jgi:hypothetical protein